jgi:hypothetical protein
VNTKSKPVSKSGKRTKKPGITLLPQDITITRLPETAQFPVEILESDFWAASRLPGELTVVFDSRIGFDHKPNGPNLKSEPGWRCLQLAGPLDFGEIGILAGISAVLASTSISIFVLSSFDTDYVFVKAERVDSAIRTLRQAGYEVSVTSSEPEPDPGSATARDTDS